MVQGLAPCARLVIGRKSLSFKTTMLNPYSQRPRTRAACDPLIGVCGVRKLAATVRSMQSHYVPMGSVSSERSRSYKGQLADKMAIHHFNPFPSLLFPSIAGYVGKHFQGARWPCHCLFCSCPELCPSAHRRSWLRSSPGYLFQCPSVVPYNQSIC